MTGTSLSSSELDMGLVEGEKRGKTGTNTGEVWRCQSAAKCQRKTGTNKQVNLAARKQEKNRH